MKKSTLVDLFDVLAGIIVAVGAYIALDNFSFNKAFLLISVASFIAGVVLSRTGEGPVLSRVVKMNILFFLFFLLALESPHFLAIPLGTFGGAALGLTVGSPLTSRLKRVLLATGFFFLSFSIAFAGLPFFMRTLSTSEVNKPAPQFSYITMENKQVKSSDLQGKVLVIDFWGTWCKPCIDGFPELEKVNGKFKNHPDFHFVAVNAPARDDSLEKVKSFVKENSYQLNFGYDESGKLREKFGFRSYPSLFVIDKKGNIRLEHSGYSEAENMGDYLNKKIAVLLAEGE